MLPNPSYRLAVGLNRRSVHTDRVAAPIVIRLVPENEMAANFSKGLLSHPGLLKIICEYSFMVSL